MKCHACGSKAEAERVFGRGADEVDSDGLYTVTHDVWADGRPGEGGDG